MKDADERHDDHRARPGAPLARGATLAMWRGLIGRWFGKAAPPPAMALRRPAEARPAAVPVMVPTAPTPVVGARRPLVGPAGAIVGFEFNVGDGLRQWLRGRVNPAGARAATTSVLAAMRLCVQGGQQAYAELPAAWLAGSADAVAPGMMLALQRGADDDPAQLASVAVALRRAGARVGWREAALTSATARASAAVAPDFIVLDAIGATGAAGAASSQPGLPWLALDLPDIDALELALRAGASLACCNLASGAEPRDARAVPAQVQALMTLLNRLVRDADSGLLAADIKRDVGLSYQLLRHLNNAGVTPGRTLASIEEAVMVLGRDPLYRWVSTQLVRCAPARPAGAALQSQALARARLLELLGQAAGEPAPGELFTLGLASLLPLLLGSTTADVLASLSLPDAARQALLQRSGPWAPYFALAEAIDQHDLDAIKSLAEPLCGVEQALHFAAQAWAFANARTD